MVLSNEDGLFDNDDEWDLFNTPVHIKKAVVENPTYADFKEIRGGNAASTATKFNEFRITVADRLHNMDDPVCRVIIAENFPSLTLLDDVKGKFIPVVYGAKKIKLIKLDNAGHYIGAEYLASVPIVYDCCQYSYLPIRPQLHLIYICRGILRRIRCPLLKDQKHEIK